MTSITHGMNPEEVEGLGHRLQQIADQVRQLTSELNGRIGSTTWVGPDATRFKDQWWPEKRANLHRIADDLHGFGQSALNNAAEQRQVSN
ncbi:WXG100 family type VII secretion target [Rhabdothermincola sediminis]|uniref:WXG100 family type VII secretion target n=1 Tax=Rhabdothermincola sediminis TaxID=2751370 RepID=UPI001AA05FF1|nr:hypothetical protein [Rhabdothermincola sediminis]